MDHVFEQVLKVRTSETDDAETDIGWVSWRVHYILYRTADDDGVECFDLYCGDDRGNAKMVCRGRRQSDMVSLTLKLGEFVEWREGQTHVTLAEYRKNMSDGVEI